MKGVLIILKYELINPINSKYSIVEQILTNRNINIKDTYHYLNTTELDVLSPLLLNNMQKGIEMLVKHLKDDNLIMIVVDEDCDGQTSSAVLLNYLHTIFPSIVESKFYYVFHEGKKHGIILDELKPNTGLIIAADSSSEEYELHDFLASQGIDVLVLDHHPTDIISSSACVINNKLSQNYPNKGLSGVGIVYKFCQQLDILLLQTGIITESIADTQIDLVAIGLIADMSSFLDLETVHLIRKGLKNIHNPFLSLIIQNNSYSIGNQVTPFGIAFYVAPYINAVTRIGTKEEKKILFEAMLDWKAENLISSTKRGCKGQMETVVEQAVRNCVNIKKRQDKMVDEYLIKIIQSIENNNLTKNKVILIKLEEEINPAICGLIANKIADKYKQPTLILNNDKSNENNLIGSARGVNNSELTNFKELCIKSNLTTLAAGHESAFGFGILIENIDKFHEYMNEQLKNITFTPSYKVDFIYNNNEINSKDIIEIAQMKEIWGQDVPEPYLVIKNVAITKDNLVLMGLNKNKPTLKITLPNGIDVIKFKSSEEEYDNLYSTSGCVIIDMIVRAELNEYMDIIKPQLIVAEYQIVKRQEYYF